MLLTKFLAGFAGLAVVGSSLTLLASDPASAESAQQIFVPKSVEIPQGGDAPNAPWTYPDEKPSAGKSSRAALSGPGMYSGTGNLPKYSFQEFNVFGEDSTVGVNLGTGNLHIRTLERSLNGPGVPAAIFRVYNSNDDTYGDAGTWKTDVRLTGLGISTDRVRFNDGTGANGTFTKSGSTWTPPNGMNVSLASSGSNWIVTYNRSGEQLTFNSSGWPIKRTDRNGTGITYGYNSGNQLVSITDATGKRIGLEYANGGSTIDTIADSSGRLNVYNTDPFSNTLTEALNFTMTSDNVGRLATLTQRGGRTLTFAYVGGGRQIEKVTVSASGQTSAVTSFAYGDGITTVTDPRGNKSSLDWDSQWRITKATDQLGHVRSQEWSPNSDVITTTDATSKTTEATYDSFNNQTSSKLPTGAASQAIYALNSQCGSAQSGLPYLAKCQIDDAGNRTAMTYDSVGNLTKKANTTGSSNTTVQEISYETAAGTVCGGKAGQICQTKDGRGTATTYTYSNGNLTKVTPPSPLGSTTYAYDTLGRITAVTDGNGAKTQYAYDSADNVLTETYANGQKLTRTFNPDRTVASETDSGNSTTITHTYNLLGLETQQKVSTASANGISSTTSSTYDSAGNLLSHNDGSTTLTYAYDAANRLRSLSEPGGSCPTDLDASGPGCVRFEYDDNGNEIKRVMPRDATQTTTRDDAGRPTRITGDLTQRQVDIAYSYTSNDADRSNIQTRTSNKEQGVAAGAVTTYAYDERDQLKSATERTASTVSASWSYTYDAAGNRISQTRAGSTGATAGTVNYGYNTANQLRSATGSSATWAYDAAGNQTSSGLTGVQSTYGDRGQVTANGSTSYASVGQGNANQLRAGTVKKVNSQLGLVRTDSMNVYRKPDGSVIGYKASGVSHWFFTDAIGSVVGVTSSTGAWEGGYSYSPYGETRAASTVAGATANPFRYIGGYSEASGYKLGARYYDASIGRFTQFDPAGQESNPYAYAACNPVNNSDPTGLDCAGDVFGLVLSAGGLALGVAGTIAGAPTLALGAAAATGTALAAASTVKSIGDVANNC